MTKIYSNHKISIIDKATTYLRMFGLFLHVQMDHPLVLNRYI